MDNITDSLAKLVSMEGEEEEEEEDNQAHVYGQEQTQPYTEEQGRGIETSNDSFLRQENSHSFPNNPLEKMTADKGVEENNYRGSDSSLYDPLRASDGGFQSTSGIISSSSGGRLAKSATAYSFEPQDVHRPLSDFGHGEEANMYGSKVGQNNNLMFWGSSEEDERNTQHSFSCGLPQTSSYFGSTPQDPGHKNDDEYYSQSSWTFRSHDSHTHKDEQTSTSSRNDSSNSMWKKGPPQSVLEAKATAAPAGYEFQQERGSFVPAQRGPAFRQRRPVKGGPSASENRVCKYYLQGNCKFGDNCMFVHEEINHQEVNQIHEFLSTIPKAVTRIPYRIATAQIDPETGERMQRYQNVTSDDTVNDESEASEKKHSEETEEHDQESSSATEPPVTDMFDMHDDMEELPAAVRKYSVSVQFPSATEETIVEAEREISSESDCGICFDNPRELGRSFGLLPGCEHVFCLECIRQWRARIDRSKENVRSCPLCRRESFFVVPLERVVYDPFRKIHVIEEYKRRLKAIPCKHFQYGKGSCPFNGSCFYLHMYPDGTLEKPSKPRLISNAEGSIAPMKGIRLSDFLEL